MILFLLACNIGLKNDLLSLDSSDEDTIIPDTASSWDTSSTDTGVEDSGVEDTGTEDTADTDDTNVPDPADQDYDGDGYSPNQGDCNDSNPNIHPVTFDDCDLVDNDCDGLIDEDGPQDIYEPNNSQTEYYDVGSYSAGDLVEIEGVIATPDDYDHYEFYLEDGIIDSFSIVTNLHAISITTDFAVELWLINNDEGDGPELIYTSNSYGPGLGETDDFQGSGISWSHPLGYDDSGYYQAVVYAISGAGCTAEYQLDLELSY